MERLHFVGLNEVDTENATAIQEVAGKHMDRIDKLIEDARLKLVVKQYNSEGRPKFSIDAHFTARGETLSIDTHGWEAPVVVAEAMEKAATVFSKP